MRSDQPLKNIKLQMVSIRKGGRADKMAQWVRVLSTNLGNLISPPAHTAEGVH